MSYPLVQLTDAPSVSATVLYDLNVDRDQYAGSDGVDFGAPEWTGAPDAVGGVDGYRTVALTHWFDASKAGAYVELGALSKVLLRSDCWLLVQMTDLSEPRWFHVWRSTPASLSPDQVFIQPSGALRGLWGISLSLTADPYLYGERVTLDPVTVGSDMSHQYAELGTVFGDAPTPLRWSVAPGPSVNDAWFTQIYSTPDGYVNPVIADIGTGDASYFTPMGTTGPPTTAPFPAGSYRPVPSLGPTPSIIGQVTINGVQQGSHLVFVRVGASVASTTFTLRATSQIAGDPQATDTIPFESPADTTAAVWVNLGAYQIGENLPTDMASEYALAGAVLLDLVASQPSGAATLYLDAVMLIPLDGPTGGSATVLTDTIDAPSSGGAGYLGWWDGNEERYWLTDSSGGLVLGACHQQAGVYAAVVPGNRNAVYVTRAMAGASAPGRQIADPITFTASYLPRYLWPAP